ncbi:sensor histidine kinase [Cohnella nanjingensis]|uniref:histidine kinase n=1 Tax=Cohnella nanjingensis TaxID=1387779 RepID=A0A7X0RVN3_9BACL|nr:HAMP domain-containing sensor histidine kinase [Cohnella nanjingensis]MBB6674450.1 HAMP domain-containing histidine kinase [Cohnella nanjingensis]
MFRNIRRRLVIVNASVLLLVLATLGAALYLNMQYRLYHDIDEILQQSKSRIRSVRHLDELIHSDLRQLQQDERTTYLFWDAKGALIGQLPERTFSLQEAGDFKPDKDLDKPLTVRSEHSKYRILQVPSGNPPSGSSGSVDTIAIVKNLGDVTGTLRALQRDIAAGIVAGVILSILLGYFLAGRALVPIRRSWDRQQQFVADASHELRTPTAVIHAQTELLLRQPNRSIEQESPNISKILRESKRMGKLVDDLLTLARTDSNQLQLQTTLFPLDDLLRELSEQFRLIADTNYIHIETDIQESMLFAGDEGRIRQLLIILLDNAFKFTQPEGRIKITGRYASHSVLIRIEDNGCGISEDDLPHIFERFYRGDKSRSRAAGGTGLGLSIAEWIVKAHGGKIRVQSAVHVGTTVVLLFPRGR